MTGFDYRIEPGVRVGWDMVVSSSRDVDDLDGDFNLHDTLLDIEATMENIGEEYAEQTGAAVVRVRGEHGWREFEWDNGSVHRYEWRLVLIDYRCPKCGSADNAAFMVVDELWESSGLESTECYRCLEAAIGRRLVPADFKPGVPVNCTGCGTLRDPLIRVLDRAFEVHRLDAAVGMGCIVHPAGQGGSASDSAFPVSRGC